MAAHDAAGPYAADAPAPADGMRLDVSGLEVRVGRTGPDVVSEVSFSVRAGQVLGLVGESGSGKTTVVLALLGHARRGLRITSGQVHVDGVDLLRLSPAQLRAVRGARVAYVPQDPSAALNPTLRVGTQLREAMRVHPGAVGDSGGRILEVLREVRLDASPDLLRRYPHQLSGGQQQRVALAMAFACRPSLIVLDEPTTGLDVSTQRHVLDTIRSLCEAYGVAAVYVSHDLAVVGGLVSDVAVMYSGRIIEIGPTARVFGDPLHPYTRGLLGAVPSPLLATKLTGIDGQPPRPGRRPAGCSFAPRCGFAAGECRSEKPAPVLIDLRAVRCLRVTQVREAAAGVSAALSHRAAAAGEVPVLSLQGVSAGYGRTPVLSGVDLDVPAESCVAVVGESGSGKTTLARCIVGLHGNWTGDIRFEGALLAASARDRPQQVLRRVQYVFQNPYTSLNPRKTVGQIVAQPLEQFLRLGYRERSERAARALADVSLGGDFLSRYPDQLSGGERQRVAIARALVVEPDLLICDEVTSALDVSVQAVIVELLRGLQAERRIAMIFITHNLALMRSIAQSVLVLRSGTVVESGPVEQVMEHPANSYTIRLIEDVPKLAGPGRSGEPGSPAQGAATAGPAVT
ncbi:MAG TPA: ABC transporter ATP-binding protein [Streptosporangiaceae bacterium]|nr:ABC transporter ATP-binding protein [Streptosporangiaceae bacterium]